jgi:hypothetical protein
MIGMDIICWIQIENEKKEAMIRYHSIIFKLWVPKHLDGATMENTECETASELMRKLIFYF